MSLEYKEDADRIEDVSAAPEQVYVRPPLAIYTYVIIACMCATMAAQLYSGLDRSALIAGFVKPAFIEDGEYWRILTGAVVHGSLLHIFMNGFALQGFGLLMEMLSNRAHVAIVFVLSAIGGGLLSLFFYPEGISVGASGGIVGLLGYLVVYAFRRRRFVSAEFRRSLLINIAFILVFGLVLYQVVDNYGHIGGMLTGVVYALIQIPSDEYENPQDASAFARAVGLAALMLYVAATGLAIYLLLSVPPMYAAS